TIHPLWPDVLVQGALAMMFELEQMLAEISGMDAVTLTPAAGAQGEFVGIKMVRAYHEHNGNPRKTVLIPASAHGTNPASSVLCGYRCVEVPVGRDGCMHLEDVAARLDHDVAAVMVTNPSTLGLFERDIRRIADAVHAVGALVYIDGANMNALCGVSRPGDIGADVLHINLHKTFSTPHGGGGPGAGPVVLSHRLAKYAPLPYVLVEDGQARLIETESEARAKGAEPFGRLTAFHGQMGMFVRALSYMLSHGVDGMQTASEDAVLNANYIRAGLRDVMSQPFGDQACMHEVLFDDKFLKDTGVTTLDFAKAMIDEGYHPMTMYFPLVVHGAMLIEPTESESKASLDGFIAVMRALVGAAKAGDVDRFTQAPRYTPRRRLDETKAAREPRLRWTPPAPKAAAE
ncbi:MAG: aminomethyl-transferring glycine dehydrogenase subunit GcvPB, partial [Hyphomicrobiaceae bacterium]|nr:aminomethyl-transferring glycine dehydrogenase subunit GcvPB [Hyphomicrobiaceae bacterium]